MLLYTFSQQQQSKLCLSPFDLRTIKLQVEQNRTRRIRHGQMRLGKSEIYTDISGFVLPRGEPWIGQFDRIIGRLVKLLIFFCSLAKKVN